MDSLYTRYQQGNYQDVYEELMDMREAVFEEPLSIVATLIAEEMMRRVRCNLELLVPRLHYLGYNFRDGEFMPDDDAEFKMQYEHDVPILSPLTESQDSSVQQLHTLFGPLSYTLPAWYKHVGCVDFVGTFPVEGDRTLYGSRLDPLLIFPAKMTLEGALLDISYYQEIGEDQQLILAPDRAYKYNIGGGPPYKITVPCLQFDFVLESERYQTTFVNYLRLCLKWGGFPGLERDNRLPAEYLAYLTQGLLPF